MVQVSPYLDELARQKKMVLTIDEVLIALYGAVSRSTIYREVTRGNIPSVRIGRTILIPSTWLAKVAAGSDDLDTRRRRSP